MDAHAHEPPCALTRDETLAFVASFPMWYRRIYLGHGIWTAPGRGFHEHVWDLFSKALPADLGGCSVLDAGCNAGFFALETKRRGAGTVVGIEIIDMFLEQARKIRQIWNVDIEYRKSDMHAIGSLGRRFDLVVFSGILYHLKNPLQVIEDLGQICDDAILVETEALPDDRRNQLVVRQGVPPVPTLRRKGMMAFIERDELNADGSNWWVPDAECVMGMLRTAGFVHQSRPVFINETRLCIVASKRENSLLDFRAFRA